MRSTRDAIRAGNGGRASGGGIGLPWSDGAKAGPGGHTLEFRRTFHRYGDDGLRGVFLMKRGGSWERPHFDIETPVEGSLATHR